MRELLGAIGVIGNDLPGPDQLVLVDHKTLKPDRTARVNFTSRDPYFRTKPVTKSIREPC